MHEKNYSFGPSDDLGQLTNQQMIFLQLADEYAIEIAKDESEKLEGKDSKQRRVASQVNKKVGGQ